MSFWKKIFGVTNSPEEEKATLKDNIQAFKNLPKFFKLIWQTHKTFTVINFLLRILKAGIPLSSLYVGKLIIDEVFYLIKIGENQDFGNLWTLIFIEFGLVLFSDLLNRSITLLDALLGDLLSNESSVQLMKHAADLDLPQFEDANFYDKLERARRQTTGRTILMSQIFAQAQEMITLFIFAAGLIFFNAWLILLLIIAVIPSFLSESYFNRSSYSIARSWTPERRQLDYLRYIGASDITAKEIKTFDLSGFIIGKFRILADQFYEVNKKLAMRRALWGSLFSGIGSAGYYVAYLYIVFQTVQGNLTIGDLTFLAGSFSQMQMILQGILARFSSIAQSALYLQDLFDFFEMQSKISSPIDAIKIPAQIKDGFVFENVGFKYPNSERWAVRNISFTLKAGEKLALVGENGAGKTTLVKLLNRLYDPDEGRILLEGIDIKKYNLLDYQEKVGVIFQDYVKFQMTVSDNIAIGKITERENKPQIEYSAKQSLADSVIDKLPQKYEQMLGKQFSKGVELSGGEWQKIALGRAYMRDAQLLILDEPTAALDARAEFEVFERFAELTQGKTAVLISHRFSTVRMADRILVLKNGEKVEIGSHEELLEMDGLYAELFHLQAKGYQ